MITILELLLHRYVRTGDFVSLYDGKKTLIGVGYAQVVGFSKYAVVYVPPHTIRRDGIVKDTITGTWSYTFDD